MSARAMFSMAEIDGAALLDSYSFSDLDPFIEEFATTADLDRVDATLESIARTLGGDARPDPPERCVPALRALFALRRKTTKQEPFGMEMAAVRWAAQGPTLNAEEWRAAVEAQRHRLMTTETRRVVATPFKWADPACIPQRSWLYGRHLIRGEISATLAPGGIGKTSLAVVEALAMATGLPLLGHQPPGPLRVFLWNGEEPVEELGRRMAAAMKHFGISPEMVGDRLFIDNGHTMPLILAEEGRDGTRVHAPLIHELIGELRRREVDVFLVDPVISTHNLSENENNGIQKLATAWKAVAVGANVAVGLAHHTRKLGGRDATTEDSRGADALIAKVRDGRVLNVMSEADAAKLGVLGRDRLSYFWTGGPGGKSNMSARTGQKEWFRLVSIDLGNGGAGGPGDSVGVVTSWRAPNVADDIEPERLVKLGAVMGERAWRAAPQAAKAPDWIGAAVATAFDLRGAEGWERKAKALVAELERRGVITLRTVVGPKRRSMPIFVFTGVSGDEGAG
jgi:hypothetical protein